MKKKQFFVILFLICAFAGYFAYTHFAQNAVENDEDDEKTYFTFNIVINKAKKLAQSPFKQPSDTLPAELENLTYDQYRDLRFIRKKGPWYGLDLPYEIQFFHLGSIYKTPVTINEVFAHSSKKLHYRYDYFNHGNINFEKNTQNILGFAGFRIHNPLNTEYYDELVSFLGASYFRGLAKNQKYGISARGLSVDTAELTGEEFPYFKEFWIVKPRRTNKYILLFALLDSKSLTGAYRFKITPGTNTIMDIDSVIFTRESVKKIGIAPLTSMFLFGENNKNKFDDYRPEVHDSDGLLIHNGNEEWLWRPLDNSDHLRISSFMDKNPKGFGLMQRDRNPDHYQDFEANYEARPSAWVEPKGNWGEGIVQLVEIPSKKEIHDNVVAYWIPKKKIEAGEEYRFSYRLIWLNYVMKERRFAYVLATRTGAAGISGSESSSKSRKFVIDFGGKKLTEDKLKENITPVVSAQNGKITSLTSIINPSTNGITVYFDYTPNSDSDEIRVNLNKNNEIISETWSYQWLK